MAYYLGRRKQGDLILFRSLRAPAKETHGTRFVSVIGPFKSKIGASYFARYGRDDPRIRTAEDVERLARADPRMEQAIVEEAMSEEELAIAHECEVLDHLENFQVNSPIPIQISTQGVIPCPIGLKTN